MLQRFLGHILGPRILSQLRESQCYVLCYLGVGGGTASYKSFKQIKTDFRASPTPWRPLYGKKSNSGQDVFQPTWIFSLWNPWQDSMESQGLEEYNLNHCNKQIGFQSTFSSGNEIGVGLDRKEIFLQLLLFCQQITKIYLSFGILSHQFQGL